MIQERENCKSTVLEEVNEVLKGQSGLQVQVPPTPLICPGEMRGGGWVWWVEWG